MVLMNVDTEQGITDGSIRNIKQYNLIDAILIRENEENLSRKYSCLDDIIASLWLGSDNNWYCTERIFDEDTIKLNRTSNCEFSDVVKKFMHYCLNWIDDEIVWTRNIHINLEYAVYDNDLAIYE